MVKSLAGRLVVVVALLAGGLALVSGAGASAQTVADVEVRDRLIADQEALLNTYRCMFAVDVEVVPGGCSDGAPASPAKDPAPFSGNPTASDITVRNELVAAQEALLNTYRCRFRIDTQQVPGGCPELADETVAEPEETEVTQQGEYRSCVTHTIFWCLLADGTWRVKQEAYRYVYEGDVQVCGELEINSWETGECVPYEASSEQLSIFPHNCGPSLGSVIDLALNLERLFVPGMNHLGQCQSSMSAWYYEPEVVLIWDDTSPTYDDVICNLRDRHVSRVLDVCLHPDTDPGSLNSFQYLGLPHSQGNLRVDRTNDLQIQKPFLNHDLVLMQKFCDRYPVAESCARVLGSQN